MKLASLALRRLRGKVYTPPTSLNWQEMDYEVRRTFEAIDEHKVSTWLSHARHMRSHGEE